MNAATACAQDASLKRWRLRRHCCAECGNAPVTSTVVVSSMRQKYGARKQMATIARPVRAKQRIIGDLWGRFLHARDGKPQCSVLVTRVWRSHLTAKELEIDCSTLLDMEGNTFADEMANRLATRAEVFRSQAAAVQATDGMACQVNMRIIEANLAAFSAQHRREF